MIMTSQPTNIKIEPTISRKIKSTGSMGSSVTMQPQRRKPSSRRQRPGCSLSTSMSHSLIRNRTIGGGDGSISSSATEGRLNVSFVEKNRKGLGAAVIGDILSSFEDDDDNKSIGEEDLHDIQDKDDKKDIPKYTQSETNIHLDSSFRKMRLQSIGSQRSVTWKDEILGASDDEEDD